jgi:hypothetical protein
MATRQSGQPPHAKTLAYNPKRGSWRGHMGLRRKLQTGKADTATNSLRMLSWVHGKPAEILPDRFSRSRTVGRV